MGKGGVRLAPYELVGEVLQVPLGSVTPLALAQPTAAGVVLLLDQRIQSQPLIFVHPLVNTVSTALAPAGLEAFLGCVWPQHVVFLLPAGSMHAPTTVQQGCGPWPGLAALSCGLRPLEMLQNGGFGSV